MRPVRALALGVVFVAFVLLLAPFVPSGPFAIDRHFRGGTNEALHRVALVFDHAGGPGGRTVTLVAIAVALAVTRRWVALATAGVAVALTAVVTLALKDAVGRPRPLDPFAHAVGTSFPSGHASYAGVTAVVLVVSFTRPGRRRLWWTLAALAIAGMCWSRVYLQVHWLSDVVAGALLGAGVALVCFAAVSASRMTSALCAPETP